MIWGLLGILEAGAAYVPLDPAMPDARLSFLISDSGIRTVVTESALAHRLAEQRVRLVLLDAELDDACVELEPAAVGLHPRNLAYVIYTSGSTGQPKGVMVEHSGLSNLARASLELLGVRPESRVLQFASFSFDASVFEIFMALAAGAALYLPGGEARQGGQPLLNFLRRESISHATFLPSTLAALPVADLPSLAVLISAGEVLTTELCARWGVGRRLLNAYGPTECTVWASLHECPPGATAPPIGKAIPGVELRVTNPDQSPVEDGQPGELCILGAGVARGYINQPELNAEKFLRDSADPERRLFRTGDLAKRLPDGEIAFLGRIDDQLKIRGFRIEPAEVESALSRHPGVREAAVVGREEPSGERGLCAYLVLNAGASVSPGALRAVLAEQLPEYMLPSTFVVLSELPRASSGKVDRRALPAASTSRLSPSTPHRPPQSEAELALAQIWAFVLSLAEVGVDDDFFDLGGDSLSALRIVSRIKLRFGRDVSVSALLTLRTVARLAIELSGASDSWVQRVPGASESSTAGADISLVQQGLWFLHALAPDSIAYHLPSVLGIRGPLDTGALEAALSEIVRRHEALRTTFPSRDGRPLAVVGPPPTLTLAIESDADLSSCALEARSGRFDAICAREFARPFDVANGPLFRTHLVRLDREEHALVLTLHHLVADGWSMAILLREVSALYDAFASGAPPKLPTSQVTYADFARYQRVSLSRATRESELAFWRRELASVPPTLGLRTDRPRTELTRFRGAQASFSLESAPLGELQRLCRSEGTTLFMALLAGFALLLRSQGAGPDLVIGTSVAGRTLPDFEGIIGQFANTVPIRTRVGQGLSFRSLLRLVRERALAAYAHQELPFSELVAELGAARDEGFQPLVQALISLQPAPRSRAVVGATTFELELLHADGAPFDLSLTLWLESDAGLAGVLVYNSEIFESASGRSLMDRLSEFLARVAAEPDMKVSELWQPAGRPADLAFDAVAMTLLEDRAVEDCAVRLRSTDGAGPDEVVAYVVGHRTIMEPNPSWPSATTIVPMTSLPHTPEGLVDEQSLAAFAVPDADLARRCEAALGARPGVGEALAIVRDRRVGTKRLHSDDVLQPFEARPIPRASATRVAVAAPDASSLPPALADGGRLTIPDDAPRSLSAMLLRTATTARAGIHFAHSDRSTTFQSYPALYEAALSLLAGLTRAGLCAGDRVILAIDVFEHNFEAFWACLLGGLCPVQVAATNTATFGKLESVWRLLGRPALLANSSNAASLRELPFSPRVLVLEECRGDASQARVHAAEPNDVAFFQLTSGSTGVPKCIPETHQAILRHILSAIDFNAYRASDTTLNWLPFDHVVPLLMCHLKDVYVGCNQIHVKTEHFVADPLLWPDLVQTHAVTHTWCPNFGFLLISNAIGRAHPRRWDLSSVVRFLNAGEQVTLAVVDEFLRVVSPFGFRRDAIQPAYGMAEIASVVSYGSGPSRSWNVHLVASTSLGGELELLTSDAPAAQANAFVDVGPPVLGVCLRIVDANNQLLRERMIGRLQVKGGVVNPGYLDNEVENRRAFVGDGWFNTGDLGFILDGSLTITGREKDCISVRGVQLYCHEIEDIVNGVPGVVPTYAAACAFDDLAQGTEGLAIFFSAQAADIPAQARVAEEIRRAIGSRMGISPARVIPLAHAEFPKTTSGKIQRAALKRDLEAGAFRQSLRALDLHAGTARTLVDAFHRPTWYRKETVFTRTLPPGICLVVSDESGLGEQVAIGLVAGGHRAILVTRGSTFACTGADHYTLDPLEPEHYGRLLNELGEPEPCISAVVHLEGYAGAAAGAETLLGFVRAILANTEAPVRVLVVASEAQACSAEEAVSPAKAALVSLVRTLSEESPSIDARHVDLEPVSVVDDARRVLRELCVSQRDREIAYRSTERWVAALERVDVTRETARALPFERGGVYLISGGLGGLGELLARFLLQQYRAHLLLVGRTPLASDAHERSATYRSLVSAQRRDGGEVLYEALDVADAAALGVVVKRAEQRWGRALDGVIHLAGTLGERLLTEETSESFARALSPKLAGAEALAAVLSDRPQALFVAASSATAYLGGFSVGAYAAANRALGAFVHELRRSGRAQSYCLAFSAWENVGMSRGRTPQAARARGYVALSPAEGLLSLQVALAREPRDWIVGLDPGHPQIARHTHGLAGPQREVAAFYTSARASLPSSLRLRDRFGGACTATLSHVEQIPRTPSGELDASAFETAVAPASTRPTYTPPSDDLERLVAELWRELLQQPRVGVDDNFFDLGGHSLSLMQLRARLHAALGRDVRLVDLFRYPTIRTLSTHLRSGAAANESALGVQQRGQNQRSALARARPIRSPLLPGREDVSEDS